MSLTRSPLYSRFSKNKVVIGIPAGSNNRTEINYGNTTRLLEMMGFKLNGYIPSGSTFSSSPEIIEGDKGYEFIADKPKQLMTLLANGALDLALVGQDTVEEGKANLWNWLSWDGALEKPFEKVPFSHRKKVIEYHFLKLFDQFRKLVGNYADNYSNKYRSIPPPLDFDRPTDNRFLSGKDWLKVLVSGNLNELSVLARLVELPQRQKAWQDLLDHTHSFRDLYDHGDLGYGRTDICWGIPKDSSSLLESKLEEGGEVVIATPYPLMAYKEVLKYVDKQLIFVLNNTAGNSLVALPQDLEVQYKDRIVIKYMPSKTEKNSKLGIADVVLDCVSSRGTFDKYGLQALDPPLLKNSTVHIWSDSFVNEVLKRDSGEYDFQYADNPNLRPTPAEKQYAKKIKRFIDSAKKFSVPYAEGRKDSVYSIK